MTNSVDICSYSNLECGGYKGVLEVELTEANKNWLLEHHPPGIIWEYDTDKPFKLHSMAAQFAELTHLGIPYRIPHTVDSKPTIRKVSTCN